MNIERILANLHLGEISVNDAIEAINEKVSDDRKLFAAFAMQGLLIGVNHPRIEKITPLAVQCADALIEELKK